MDSLLVLFGFHNSLNTNLKRSGTSNFIHTFEQFAWILSRFCTASFPQLLVLFGFHNLLNTNCFFPEHISCAVCSVTTIIIIRNVAEHRISFSLLNSLHGFSSGFVWLLSHSSWFCLASTTRLIQI